MSERITSSPERVHGESDQERVNAITAEVRAEFRSPNDESIVRIAAAHNELRKLPATAVSALYAECLIEIAQFFYISGKTTLGFDPASKAVEAARSISDMRLLRRALMTQGIMHADSGNFPGAIECYAGALEVATRSQDAIGEGSVWNNLGATLLYSAQYTDAIAACRRALALSEREPELASVRPLALSNIALACLHTEQYENGLTTAELAVQELSNPKGASELLSRVIVESHFSRLLLEAGRVAEAKRHCEAAKSFAAMSHSQRSEQVASIAEGLYEVFAGKTDIGLSRLQAALQQQRVLKASLRDALIALVKAYDFVGNHQLSLVHLRELLRITRKAGQERALGHHQLHLRSLGVEGEPAGAEDIIGTVYRLDRERVRSQLALLHRQSIAAELIEDPSGEHIFRVGRFSALLGSELGLDDDSGFILEMSARLHDIGKIGIPEAIIAKRGKINPDQRALVQTHANIGAELLSQSGLPHIQMAVDVARHHHEKWDGSGYPDGLAMEAIPEVARIVALADSFDAMTHDRPYRKAMSVESALSEINAAAGTKFDPGMTEVFSALVLRLRKEHSDLDAFLGAEAQESPFIRARKKISEALQQAKESGGLAGL
jgi:putative two-component system response regulator